MTTVASVWTHAQFLDGTVIKGHTLSLRTPALADDYGFSGGGMQAGTFGAAVVRAPRIGPACAA